MIDTTLHGCVGTFRLSAAAVALEACEVQHKIGWHTWEEIKQPEYLAINPRGKVPALQTSEGCFNETAAIIRYAGNVSGKLYGQNNFERAQVDQWLDYINCDMAPLLPRFLYQIHGWAVPGISYQKGDMFRGKADFFNCVKYVDSQLTNGHLVAGQLSIADLTLGCYLFSYWNFVLGDKERKGLKNMTTLFENLIAVPAFKKWHGRLRMVPKGFNFARVEAAPKPAAPKQQKKKKPAQPQQKKKKAPIHPDTNLNLNTFKTYFINEKDRAKAMERFYEVFEEENWGVYRLNYIPYKDDVKDFTKIKNLLTTFLSNYQQTHKWNFGTHLILEKDGLYVPQGIWLIRGKQLIKQYTDNMSYITYNWDKLDVSKEEDRQLIDTFWNKLRNVDEDTFEGQTLRQFNWVKQ